MYPDHLALLTITGIGKSVANSALPNAPVVDDSNDRRSAGARLNALRKRLAELVWPGELIIPSANPDPAPAGC
jgi:hypothetical protein